QVRSPRTHWRRGVDRQRPQMAGGAVDIALVGFPDAVRGLTCQEFGWEIFVERQQDWVGRGVADEGMIDHQQVKLRRELFERLVAKGLERSLLPDNLDARMHLGEALGRG